MILENACTFQVFVDKEAEKSMFEASARIYEEFYEKYGLRMSCSPARTQGRKGLTKYTIGIRIDKEKITRNAGRKRVEGNLSMEDALNLEIQGMKKKNIADQMGISLATYYRRRSEYLEKQKL